VGLRVISFFLGFGVGGALIFAAVSFISDNTAS